LGETATSILVENELSRKRTEQCSEIGTGVEASIIEPMDEKLSTMKAENISKIEKDFSSKV